MLKINRLVVCSLLDLLSACMTTNPERLTLVKGQTSDGAVGFNGKGEVVIESEKNAINELLILQFVNENLAFDLKEENRRLSDCKLDLSDPANGGDSKISQVSEVDNLRKQEQEKEVLTLHGKDDQITIVKSKSFTDTLKNEKAYKDTLEAMLKVTNKYRTKCEFNLKVQVRLKGAASVSIVADEKKKNEEIIENTEAALNN